METLLERQRHAWEEMERLESAVSARMLSRPRTVRDRLQVEHEVCEMVDRISRLAGELQALYDDTQGAREKELANLSITAAATGLDHFYEQLDEVRTHHSRYPDDDRVDDLSAQLRLHFPDAAAGPADAPEEGDVDRFATLFNDEEHFGRYLDLHEHYKRWINLKGGLAVPYAKYVETFDALARDLSAEEKRESSFVAYLTALEAYVLSFWQRLAPLEYPTEQAARIREEAKSALGTLPNGAGPDSDRSLPEGGVWCDACKRPFAKQTVFDAHLTGKKHKQALLRVATATKTTASDGADVARDVAASEAVLAAAARRLATVLVATRDNVVRKQTLTEREWLAERANAAAASRPPPVDAAQLTKFLSDDEDMLDLDDDDDDASSTSSARANGASGSGGARSKTNTGGFAGGPSNPLNFPLGWDGRPIPPWLYRLHGLGNEFPCEICGNHVYLGRRNFDRHFREPRHVQGLKMLGIVDTSAAAAGDAPSAAVGVGGGDAGATGGADGAGGLFDQVTAIADALQLKAAHARRERDRRRRKDHQVEMEDDQGNVMSERVYKDLVAQGIL